FPRIIDILLISNAENADTTLLKRLAHLIEGQGDPFDDILRHRDVDLAGQLDETRVQVIFSGNPGQIKWIDGYAVSAQSRPGIEGLETERFRLGRPDHFPDVDPHGIEDNFELVHESNVDGAI